METHLTMNPTTGGPLPTPKPTPAVATQQTSSSIGTQPPIPSPVQPNVFNMDMGLLGKYIKGISISLDSYTGLDQDKSIDEFITDLQDYVDNTASCPIQTCRSTLKGEAREFFRELMTNEPYISHQKDLPFTEAQINDFYTKLRERFTLSEALKRTAYLEVFSMRQISGESFPTFVLRVQKRCRTLNVDKQHVLSICIGGAHPSIRPFLITSNPSDIQTLLSLPISRQEHLVTPETNTLVNVLEDEDYANHQMVSLAASAEKALERKNSRPYFGEYNPSNYRSDK